MLFYYLFMPNFYSNQKDDRFLPVPKTSIALVLFGYLTFLIQLPVMPTILICATFDFQCVLRFVFLSGCYLQFEIQHNSLKNTTLCIRCTWHNTTGHYAGSCIFIMLCWVLLRCRQNLLRRSSV